MVPVWVVPAGILFLGQRSSAYIVTVGAVVTTHAALHFWMLGSTAHGALIPYVTLVLGFALWAFVLRDRLLPALEPDVAAVPAGDSL